VDPDEYSMLEMDLEHGDLLTMEGKCQKHTIHMLPRALCTEPRINLTWRWIRKHSEDCPLVHQNRGAVQRGVSEFVRPRPALPIWCHGTRSRGDSATSANILGTKTAACLFQRRLEVSAVTVYPRQRSWFSRILDGRRRRGAWFHRTLVLQWACLHCRPTACRGRWDPPGTRLEEQSRP
jgi:hypothetical protein